MHLKSLDKKHVTHTVLCSFQTMIVGEEAKLEIAKKEISSLESTVKALTELYNSFGNNGIPSFITESALVDLEIQTAEFMNRLSPGTTMQLKSTKKETSKRDGPAAEKIEKVVGERPICISFCSVTIQGARIWLQSCSCSLRIMK